MKELDCRAARRFPIRLPMTVRWTIGEAVGEIPTESENISSRGVYFFLPKQIKDGSALEILMTLPHELTLAGPLRVRCQGRVRRMKIERINRVGVAAEIEGYAFLRGGEDLA